MMTDLHKTHRMPHLDEPLAVQIAYRREQLDYHHRVKAWWDLLTDDHRLYALEAYGRSNGGFTNAANAMLWWAEKAMPKAEAA